MAASAKVSVGSHVWVEDPEEAWIDGEVEDANSDEITVNCSGKTVVAKVNAVYPKDPEFPELGVDDMTKLAYLHEPGLLLNLKCRYDANEIYTYTGNILIAVNPFKRLPHLYGIDTMKQYKGTPFGELSPHPFAVADSAYRKMINEGVSQAILVSGESGAGKTESTKMLMRFLAYMGGRAESEGRSVEQQVLESNPVLEAFGNAKTVRNNNSSRFGKFVEIQFDQRGRISGAAIRTYLLERSRVCQVSDPERNYHCFYMLCAAPEQETERYKLGKPSTFRYLNQSNCYALDGLDDSKEYLATRKAMDVVGIGSEDQDAIFRVVAAILHLGNIEFAKGEESEAAEPKDEKSLFHLKTAAELFMCDEKALEDSLCKRVMVTRDESITKSLDPDSAALGRDALAKIVYSKLFDWLVTKINNSIGQDPDSKHIIGVLDIYGFESFKTNRCLTVLKQFCINLTNEKLQQHFNQHVFKMEQEEYTKEEIDWSYIEFIDNQDILDLIEKKPGGIIALLDEACMFPRSTHDTFAQKLYQTFKDHKRFSKPKLAQTDFTICHYAGDVTYQTEALLSSSDCSFVSSLFPPLPEESSKTSKFSSIGSQFKHQLQSLLESLSTTEPHYIRCVKPNNLLKPEIFENINILQQLRCGGVMEAIRISCAGYPTRKPFNEFLTRFKILAPETTNRSNDEVDACKKLLAKVDLKGFQIGKTKVFLRAGQMAELDAHRAEVLGRSARIIQRKVLSYQSRKKFLLLQAASTDIQALCRGQVARVSFEKMRIEVACLRIQNQARTYICQKSYKSLCSSACSVQTGMRAKAARVELQFRKKRRAAIIIQSQTRRFLCRRHYVRMKKAAIATQCGWRVRVARRELRNLKMAAKEAGALQDAKSKLENQLEELTSNLELEKQMRMEIEEAKSQEIEALQSALTDIKLKLKETQETKSAEISRLQSALQDMQLEIEELSKGLEMSNDLSAENEQLKELVSSLQNKNDGDVRKLSEEQIKQEVPVIDQTAIIKLEAENQQLKQRKKRQIPPTLASIDDLEKFTQLSSHPLHKTSKPGIFSVDILHSKDVIATGGIDTTAVLFDRPSGQILSTLTGHSKKVTSIKFVGDTDLVLTASSDKTVCIWGSSEDGNYACILTLKDHSAEVRAVTVHATNKYFVSASLDSTWCFYDMSSGLRLAQVADDSEKVDYTAAAFHPDGLILGTGTAQSIVKIWDVKSQANVAKFGGHTGEITSVSFSENGYFLATSALDGVRLWDLRKLKNFRTFEFPDANSVEFDHSGSYLGIAASDIRVFQTASVKAEWNPVKTLPVLSGTGKATCVKFGPDPKYVAVGSMDRNLRICGLPSDDSTEDSAQDS